ncbi:MAG: FHA domain-containing protein [Cyanobacteria bacterium J06573_2]
MINSLSQLIRKNICRIVKYSTSSCPSSTAFQTPVIQLRHIKSNKIIELPANFSVLVIGKASKKNIPDIDLSHFSYSELVSRNHAQICFDGKDYFIQDTGSTNGTYINKYPMLPGIWYKIGSKVNIGFDKRNIVSFIFINQ